MNRCKPGVVSRAATGGRDSASARKAEVWLELLRRADPAPAGTAGELTEPECILLALAQAIEQRDSRMAGHCERLALISVAIGIAMRLSHAELLSLYRGGYLHDIGKVGMPDSILLKPAALTAEEWVVMRSHTLRGEQICRPMRSLDPVLPIIRSHHEHWDGTGYPDGLRVSQIPLLARVVQTADIYDALTSPRPYKPALTSQETLAVMSRETDRGWRDPEIMALFLRMHPDVISPLADYNLEEDHSLRKMRSSMHSLQRFLARDAETAASCAAS